MNELRKFLGGAFAIAAILLAWGMLATSRSASNTRSGDIHSAELFLLGAFILNAAAAWTVLMNRRSARILGLTASVAPLLALLVIASHFHVRLIGVPWIAVGLAVAGLIAFLPRNQTQPSDARPPAPIKGDGTNKWIGKSIWVIGTLGFLFGLNWWWHWAQIQGLPWGGGTSFFLQLVLADLVIVLLHELGHTITGLALGMKLRAFIVGPFQWHMREAKWEFKLRPGGFFSTGGSTGLVPTNPRQSVWERACMIAAGPFASLASGALALCAALTAPGHPWQPAWLFLACVATLSLEVGILNLVPSRTETTYSDGAQIYQLLSGGPWADYHRAVAVVTSTLVTQLRPRDYDIDAIRRAVSVVNNGRKAMFLHLWASSYHLDRGEFHEAADSLAQAERVYQESASDISAELHTAFVFRKAFLQRDAAGTRQWWDRMEAKKPTRFNVDYWLARAALLWIEKNLDEARAAWEKANALAQDLPKFGAYDFDRYRCALLRKALDESTADEPLQPIGDTAAAPA